MNETEILAFIIQLLCSYIFVSVATNNAQKQTVIDNKQDLRTTKEDLMPELKDTREAFLRESEISTKAIIDIIKAEVSKELEKARKGNNANGDNQFHITVAADLKKEQPTNNGKQGNWQTVHNAIEELCSIPKRCVVVYPEVDKTD